MSLATDIAADMSFMDGYTAMTLGPRNPTASDVSCYGIDFALSAAQVALYGGLGLGPSDRVIHIQASTTGSTVPKQGDKLTVGSDVYTILAVDTAVRGTVYQCVTRKEA